MNRQLAGNLGQQAIAARIAPENQVMSGNVGISDRGVVLHARIASELPPPMLGGMLHFGRRPGPDLVVCGLAGRAHHKKAVHEGVIDRALQSMPLLQAAFVYLSHGLPTAAILSEVSRPRSIRQHRGRVNVLAIENYLGLMHVIQRAMAGGHAEA